MARQRGGSRLYRGVFRLLEGIGLKNARARWESQSPFIQRAVPPLVIAALVILVMLPFRAPDPAALVLLAIVYALYVMPRTWRRWALPATILALRDRVPAPHPADELPAVPVRGAHLQQLPEHRHDGGDGHLRDDGRGPEHGRRLRGPPRPRLRRVLRARRLHGGLARLAARIAVRPRREADRRQYRRQSV